MVNIDGIGWMGERIDGFIYVWVYLAHQIGFILNETFGSIYSKSGDYNFLCGLFKWLFAGDNGCMDEVGWMVGFLMVNIDGIGWMGERIDDFIYVWVYLAHQIGFIPSEQKW